MERKIPDIYVAEISPKFLKSVYGVELKRGSIHGRTTFYGPVHLTLIRESWKKNPKRGTITERVLRKKIQSAALRRFVYVSVL